MSAATDAATAWERLMLSTHTPPQWRRILDAATHANRSIGRREGGTPAWCQAAMHAIGTPADLDPDRAVYGPRVVLDPAVVRRWLATPVACTDEPITIADLAELADLSRESVWAAHEAVVAVMHRAGAAGLFGAAGHAIEVHQVADHSGWLVGHMLVARSPDGHGIATPVLPVGMTAQRTGERIADAIAVLGAAADQLNPTLDSLEQAAHTSARTGAFPALARAATFADAPTPVRPAPVGQRTSRGSR